MFTLLLAQGGEFAFVVFQAATGSRVLSPELSSLLIGAVAVSMLLSPLLLVAIDKLLMPRWANCNIPQLEEISRRLPDGYKKRVAAKEGEFASKRA